MFLFIKKNIRRLKLTSLYFRRIVFSENHFRVSLLTKLRANLFGGYLSDQYVLYDLKNGGKREYLSEFDWYRSRYINAPYDFLLNNKIACTQILQQYTRVPEIYCMKTHGVMASFSRNRLSAKEVLGILQEKKDCFFKPSDKGKGNGIRRLQYTGAGYLINGSSCSESDVLDIFQNHEDWILCETIRQGEFARELYSKTANTMRLITFRDVNSEEFRMFFAVQRIGREKTIPVDNGSRGGLVSKINIENGELSEARSLHDLEEYAEHPDSHHPIRGQVVPGWDAIKTEVLRLSAKLPYLSFIAWDILLMEEGFAVIEANTSSGVNIIQLWGGQRQGELGDFYRHHRIRV